jgi:hypothetical protein
MSNFIGGMRASGNGLLLRASPDLQKNAGYLALLALFVYIASFEIYPTGIRSKAMSVSTVVNWLANFVVAGTFLTLISLISRQGTFFVFGGLGVLAILFFIWKVPETKDKSLEQIQKDLIPDKTGGAESKK